MSAGCCNNNAAFDGMSVSYKRRLWAIIIINAVMFGVEMTAGYFAKSQALQADALDFFSDAAIYTLSLAVIGTSLRTRASAALFKGATLLALGLWVAGTTLWQVTQGIVPEAPVMGAVGFLALGANLLCLVILLGYRHGDANVRSVWLCSRNDAIGNVAVMLAALGVWGSAHAWPDLVVAGLMAGLFIWSAVQILRQAMGEWRSTVAA